MANVSAGQSVGIGGLATGRARRFGFDLPGLAALVFIRGGIGLALLYAATILYGVVAGYALPAAAVFHMVPHPGLIARVEDYLPRFILVLALAGACFGWLAYLRLIAPGTTRQNQRARLRSLHRWGFLLSVTIAVLMLSNAWSGLILGSDSQYASIGGLVPHSDAAGYFLAPAEQLITGTWGNVASHRPLAEAFRQLTVAPAGFSYVWTLLIQAVFVSAAFYTAARSIALWRGLWCALAFTAFSYLLVRPFITNTYTESLGLFWGFLSVTFFVESMRAGSQSTQANSLGFAFLALVTITVGEMTRMGSMFTIPAFVLWIAVSFASTVSGRIRLFAIASGLVLLVLALQALLSALYGSSGGTVGGNFAYTLCGLSVAGDWGTCPKIYAQEFGRLTTEREQTAFLFSKALAVMAHDPLPMLGQLLTNIGNLIEGLPGFVMLSYVRDRDYPWCPFVVLVPGLCWSLFRLGTRREWLFWALMLASIVASAAIIFADDGWRVFYTTWPFVLLFASLGFASPGVVRIPARSFTPVSVRGGTALVAIMAGLIALAPGATTALYGQSLRPLAASTRQLPPQETILFGRTLTGFAVIADDKPLPLTIPAMHAADFRRIAERIGIERDFGKFVDVALEHVPFAFVTAVRLDNPANQPEMLYVAPVEILSEPAATAWHVALGQEIRLPDIRDILSYQRLK